VQVARELYPDVRIVEELLPGKGAALRAGLATATGDVIVLLDADGSTNPAEIPAFVGALLSGADFVKGSRFIQGAGTVDMPFYRRLGNWGFVKLVRILFGGNYSDLCYGYNAMWSDVVPRLELNGDGFEIEAMMSLRALRAKLRIVEVASFEEKRIHGVSRLRTFPDGWRVLKAIFHERFRKRMPNESIQGKKGSSIIQASASPDPVTDESAADLDSALSGGVSRSTESGCKSINL
jgi:glycosyltransferase involved in cell wall biosynthesis